MGRVDLSLAAALALLFVPTADALQCPKGQQTSAVYVTLSGCANAPKEFVIRINGTDHTVTRADPAVARWHVTIKPFCIPETFLTSAKVPGFHTGCNVKARREGPATAPVAVFDIPCAEVWGLIIEKEKDSESHFLYRVSRDARVSCGPQPALDERTKAPDSVGDLAIEDHVTVSVAMPRQRQPLVVTVKEPALRAKPKGARFGLLYRGSARNESTDQVRDAYADRVDLIFKKDPPKKDDAK